MQETSILHQENNPKLTLLVTVHLYLSLPLFSVVQPSGPALPQPQWQSVGDVMKHNGD